MDDWPAWTLVTLGAIIGGGAGNIITGLFGLRTHRAQATRAMVEAQSTVIRDLAFAYDLVTQQPEIVRWIKWAQKARPPTT